MDNRLDAQWLIEVRERMASRDVHAPADGWQRLSAQLPVAGQTVGNRWLLRVAAILIPVLIGVFLWRGMEYQDPTTAQILDPDPTPVLPSWEGVQGYTQRPLPITQTPPQPSMVLTPPSCSPVSRGAETPQGREFIPSPNIQHTTSNSTSQGDGGSIPNPTPVSPSQEIEEATSSPLGGSEGGMAEGVLAEVSQTPPHRGLGGSLLSSLGALPISSSRGMHPGGTPGNPSADDMSENITSSNHYSWSIGIMASKRLSNMFAIESGIIYTQMGSTIHIFNNTYDQTVRYIGIPLHLCADIYDMPTWNVYVTAGPTLDFCIDAKRGDQPLSMPLTQWSANGYVGIQYLLNNHWSIYVQPGVRYYIRPDEKSHTQISEHPLQFDLQVGTRISY